MISLQNAAPPIVLASGSAARRRLLEQAGLRFHVETVPVDETGAREALAAEGVAGPDAAVAIAELKARRVASQYPSALVLGGDQLLETANGAWLDKPEDRTAAREQLQTLAGGTHRLHTAAVVFRGGARIWHRVVSPAVTLRPLTPAAIEAYLEAAGEDIFGCVGAYQVEGLGVHLFSRLDGDSFAIQGLPLLDVLACLRDQGAIG